jgi:hypothetical protein
MFPSLLQFKTFSSKVSPHEKMSKASGSFDSCRIQQRQMFQTEKGVYEIKEYFYEWRGEKDEKYRPTFVFQSGFERCPVKPTSV